MHPVYGDQFLVRVQDREKLRHAGKRRWAAGSLRHRASSFDNSPRSERYEERQVEPIDLKCVAPHILPPEKGI